MRESDARATVRGMGFRMKVEFTRLRLTDMATREATFFYPVPVDGRLGLFYDWTEIVRWATVKCERRINAALSGD